MSTDLYDTRRIEAVTSEYDRLILGLSLVAVGTGSILTWTFHSYFFLAMDAVIAVLVPRA